MEFRTLLQGSNVMRDNADNGRNDTGLRIEIGYRGSSSEYGSATVITGHDGHFDWELPSGAQQVYFSSQTAKGRVRLIDEGVNARLWTARDGAARYTPIHVSVITRRLRGVVQTIV